MEKVYKSFSLNKIDSKNDFLKYEKSKPRFKIDYIACIVALIAVVLGILGAVISLYFFAASFVLAVFALFKVLDSSSKRRRDYCLYLESELKKEAQGKNMLSLNSIYPVFLRVDDNKKEFEIIYQDDVKLLCEYSDFKNYKIYCNSYDYPQKQRLPEIPNYGIRKYIMEINFRDENKILLEFENNNPKFNIKGKWIYQQHSHTKTINSLAKIIDQILAKRF